MAKKEIVIEESERVHHSKEKALRRSIYEGSAASFSSGLGDSYITPFALALGANTLHIGLLSSFSGLFSPIAQLSGSKLMEKFSRKRIVMSFVLLQAIAWLFVAGLSFLYIKGFFVNYLPIILIVAYTLVATLGGVAYPAWFSWMGDLVPEQERGRYFSKRNRITGAVGLIAFFVGAFLLDAFKTRGFVLLGFSLLFALSFIFRFISFSLLRRQFNPKFRLAKGYYFSFWSFLKRYDNFGKFAVYQAVFYFAIMIASPFFSVYMLEDLGFNYITFMIVNISSSIFYLLFLPLAGRFSDKFGNLKLLYIGGAMFFLTPVLWLFIKSPIWLILIPQVVSGLASAAFLIAANDFTYDSVSPRHRGLCAAYTSVLVGAGVFFGSLVGGILAKYVHVSFMSPILFVFLVSAVFRFSVSLFFLPQIKEIRRVKGLPPFSLTVVHPFKALHADFVWVKNFFRS